MRALIIFFILTLFNNSFAANPIVVQHYDFDSSWTPSWSNVVWYWKMNGGTGYTGAVTVDKGGTTCTATASKTFIPSGRVDQALSVGVTGYGQNLLCAASAFNTISNNITIAGWVKVQSNTALSYGSLFGAGITGTCTNGNLGVQRNTLTNGIFLRIDTSGGNNQTYSFGTALDGNWHHIAFTLASGAVKTYLDGVLKITSTYVHGTGFASNDGGSNTCTNMYFTSASTTPDVSVYDEFAIWNVVLSDTDIATIYNKQLNGIP